MSSFPNSPKLTRGAIVGIDKFNPVASIIVFQYNPEEMKRTLVPQYAEEEKGYHGLSRLQGPPKESITMSVELDATDQLERAEATAQALGIHPALASLEMLLYPKSAYVIGNAVLALTGSIEIIPPASMLTLLVWGVKRVLPVRLKTFTVDEQHYDTQLNPIHATVSLELEVQSYTDLGLTSVGGAMFMAHQVVKEAMAVIGSINGSISAITG